MSHRPKENPPEGSAAARPHVRRDSPWTAVALITQLGLTVALCIAGSVLLGVYVDRLVGSHGVAILVGIGIGICAAGWAAWQLIKQELPWNL